ncbi:MAG: DMT family transporter [Lentisphaerae bacterium]|nr:DMT family transporter [Lentisphaerota bacterium]
MPSFLSIFHNAEWLLIVAVGTALSATFTARAAMKRGFTPAPLALMTMTQSFLFVVVLTGLMAAPGTVARTFAFDSMGVALVGGMVGALGLCCSYPALRQASTGPASTVMSMSVLVPIVAGLLAGWDPPLSRIKWVGCVLTLVATAAIHLGKSARAAGERYHWVWLATGAMLCFGVSQAAQKFITVLHPLTGGEPRYLFMATYYFACMPTLLVYIKLKGLRLEWRAWPYAMGLALSSFVQFLTMLVLLQHVSTALVYITFNGGSIVLILLVSAFMLGERYRPLVWIGSILGIVGIVLMRL